MCQGKGSQRGIAKPSSREIPPKVGKQRGEKRVLQWGWEALGWRGCSHHPCPPTGPPIAPQSLIALGKPEGKEWEGEAETDAEL